MAMPNELRAVLGEITATNRSLTTLAHAMTTRRPSHMGLADPAWDATIARYAELHDRLIELKRQRARLEGWMG